MLKVITNPAEIRYSAIMEIYSESNRISASLNIRHTTLNEALFDVENQFYHYLTQDFLSAEGAFLAVWEDAGQWVSALRIVPYLDGLLLAGLETHPGHRGKGFASALVQYVLQFLGSNGPIYSHVKKQNIPSLKIHEKYGFHIIQNYSIYIDGSVDDDCFTLCCKPLG